MSQFEKKAKMAEKVITSLADLGTMYGEHTNLTLRCRVGWVQSTVNPTKRSKAPGVFNAVLIAKDGIADCAVWDPETMPNWLSQVDAIVEITGMSCSRHKPASLDFARAPGDYGLNVNKGRYSFTIIKGFDDPTIPKNGSCPPAWLRRAVTPPQNPRPTEWPSPADTVSSWGGGTYKPQGGTCCDAPHDRTCKATGLAHVATCAVCNGLINELQPFCSRARPGSMVKCSAAARLTTMVPSSPFKEVFMTEEDRANGLPPPKRLKMATSLLGQDETEDET